MSNEITVKLNCDIKEIDRILEHKNFKKINEYILNDIYYIPINIDIKTLSIRNVLSNAILIRQFQSKLEKNTTLTFKKKKFKENGEIVNQEKFDCEIMSVEDGENFLQAIGYKKLMTINEKGIIFQNEELEIQVKDIINGDNLIEVELKDSNKKINTIEKIKKELTKLNLPIDNTDYFIKKAEIELKKLFK